VPALVVTRQPLVEAARIFADAWTRAGEERGARGARVAVPGGSAMHAIAFARARISAEIWARTRLTWTDERCVRFASAQSNRGEAHRTAALDSTQPPHLELALYLDGETAEQAVARATAAIERELEGALDATLLGMGEDGHIASLFPGRSHATTALVAYVADSPKPPPERITLTRSLLETASVHVLVAAGEPKRAALERLMKDDPALPASGLRGLTIVTDLILGSDEEAT